MQVQHGGHHRNDRQRLPLEQALADTREEAQLSKQVGRDFAG
jgi:hypothetical protein